MKIAKTPKSPSKRLPNKLWQLLQLAVKDAQKVEGMKNFRLNMHTWVSPMDENAKECEVCMAGAIMVCELKAHKSKDFLKDVECDWESAEVIPENFSERVGAKLDAVNLMRTGDVLDAYLGLNIADPADPVKTILMLCEGIIEDDFEMEENGRASWYTYSRVADILKLINV